MINCIFENKVIAKPHLRHVVVDAILLKENNILLAKRSRKLLEGGKWGLLGGYMSENETLIEAVEREIFEESGYRVNNLKLLRVIDKPNRPGEDRQNISFVFFGIAGNKEGESDWEVEKQKWFDFNNLPLKEELAFDHFESIQLYLKFKNHDISIPILF